MEVSGLCRAELAEGALLSSCLARQYLRGLRFTHTLPMGAAITVPFRPGQQPSTGPGLK